MISSREEAFMFPKARECISPFTKCQTLSIILVTHRILGHICQNWKVLNSLDERSMKAL